MAKCHEWVLWCAQILWILLMLLAESIGEKNKILYMQGSDCGSGRQLGGATVYSHFRSESTYYSKNTECRITFRAPHEDWRLMLRVEDLDIPDKSFNELCNDALYVYDASTIMGRALKQAGGNGGLCGSQFPPIIYSTGPYLTIYFRTDSSGPEGRGFRLVITAFSDDYEKYNSCGSQFQCSNKKCIDPDLTCDNTDHCGGDFSDETRANCGGFVQKTLDTLFGTSGNATGDGFLEKFLSLGVTAAISITVGTVVVFIVCVVCIICCCCRCMRKQPQTELPPPPGATVTINNGGPPLHYHQAPSWHVTTSQHTPSYRGTSYEDLRAYSHAGSSVYSHHHHSPAAPIQYHSPSYMSAPHHATGVPHHGQQVPQVPHHPQGYFPMQQVQTPQGLTYSPYPPQRESYTHSHSQGSGYSSQPPPSYHRSYTPTSSRSGRSMRSNESSIVKYEKDKLVTLPVNL